MKGIRLFSHVNINMSVTDFLTYIQSKYSVKFSEEGYQHYLKILTLIENKMLNPDTLESKFITKCFEEDCEWAKEVADTRNKESFSINLFQEFCECLKKTSEYKQKQREES